MTAAKLAAQSGRAEANKRATVDMYGASNWNLNDGDKVPFNLTRTYSDPQPTLHPGPQFPGSDSQQLMRPPSWMPYNQWSQPQPPFASPGQVSLHPGLL